MHLVSKVSSPELQRVLAVIVPVRKLATLGDH